MNKEREKFNIRVNIYSYGEGTYFVLIGIPRGKMCPLTLVRRREKLLKHFQEERLAIRMESLQKVAKL